MKVLRAFVLLVSACAAADPRSGRYTGAVTPSSPGPLCLSTRAYLLIRDDHVLFAPDEGTWVLEGIVAASGTITADKSRLAANNQIYDTTFEGKLTQDTITGSYKTPRCTASVTLSRR